MKTLIAFASSHGSSETVALELKKTLPGEVYLMNLKKERHIDLSTYERVIIGGSIHAGRLQKKVRKFCEDHTVELLKKQLGLFLCCMHRDEAQKNFELNYPEVLRKHAVSTQLMGGEFRFNKMNFFEKAIVKKVAGITESVSDLDYESIRKMAMEMEVEKVL